MAKIGLATYVLQVHHLNRPRNEFEPLGAMGPKDVDFFRVLRDYLADRTAQHLNDEQSDACLKVIAGSVVVDEVERSLSGLVEAGPSARNGNLRHKQTFAVVAPTNSSLALTERMYFRFQVPATSTRGKVIVQKNGNFGFITALRDDLNKWLREKGLVFRAQIETMLPAEIWDNVLSKSEIKELILVRYVKPAEASSADTREGVSSRSERVETRYIAGYRGTLPWLYQILKDSFASRTERTAVIPVTSVVKVIEEEKDKPIPDAAKVMVKLPFGKYQMDLSKPQDLSIPYDITSNVAYDSAGCPTWDSIHTIAVELERNMHKLMC